MTEGTPRFTITRISRKKILAVGFVNLPEGMKNDLEKDCFVFTNPNSFWLTNTDCIFDLLSEGQHLAFVTVKWVMRCDPSGEHGGMTQVWFNLADNLKVLEEMGKKDAE